MTRTFTQPCGCKVTRLYCRGDLLESFVEPCNDHAHLLDGE